MPPIPTRGSGAGSRTAVFPLVPSTEKDRLERRALSHEKGPDPLRCIELVPGDGEEIHPEGIDGDRDLTHRLGRIRMEAHSVVSRQGGKLGDGLDGADLVVGVHDGHQHGVLADRPGDVPRGDPPVPVDGQYRQLPASLGQVGHGPRDGRVLDGAGDEVPAPPL